jgi:putative hydrolase of the HAD superfamily
MAKKIETIFFDLGNVLVKYDTSILVEGYGRYGTVTHEDFTRFLHSSREANGYMEGKINSSVFYTRTKRLFDLDVKFAEFYDVWNSMFWGYPEMEKAVRNIKEKHSDIRLVLLSNTNEAHFDFIRREYAFLDLFDHYIVSHEVGYQKPHRRIYRAALKVGINPAARSFYTDDMPRFIKAAREMGMHAYQFTGYEDLRTIFKRFNIEI